MNRSTETMSMAALVIGTLVGCANKPTPQPAVAKQNPHEVFVSAFEAGRFDQLGTAIQLLERAHEQNPRDPENTLLLALAHFWAAAESGRSANPDPETRRRHTEAQLRYFKEASVLDPNDHRIPGWIGGSEVALAALTKDPALLSQGLGNIDRGVNQYPEFNHFIAAIVRQQLPPGDPAYAQGVAAMWKTLDLCIGATLDRNHPDMAPFMHLYTAQGPKRSCWSVPKARHNFEGFFLIMGDMLLKSGKPDQAKVLYLDAKLSHTYADWNETFKQALDERLADDLGARAAKLRDQDPANDPSIGVKPYSCMICHQR